MSKMLLTVILLLGFSLPGISQQNVPGDISIEEKLGDQVAMDVVLKDENGNDITLRDLVDKPTVLFFNYFRCPGICPVLISNVAEVINQMLAEPGTDYRLVAVSFDPADTPALALQKKANYLNQLRRPFSPESWRFLTGTAENSKAVADSTGFNYLLKGDMYQHPAALIVLTPSGMISRYMYGTQFLAADVEMAIQEAASEKVRPTISKMLAFCYTYDPEGRGYVFSITRFVGSIILVLAVIFIVFVMWGRSKKKAKTV